jgi:hypothetical protein
MRLIRAVGPLCALAALALALPAGAAAQPACGDVLTTNTVLEADLPCSTDAALTIGADDVTLDLGGFTVEGSDVGVDNPGFDRVTIRNGTAYGAGFGGGGVVLTGAEDNRLLDLAVSGFESGIALVDSNDNLVRDVVSSQTMAGVRALRSDGNRIVDSNLKGGDWGLFLIESDDNDLVNSTTTSSYESIQVRNANGNRFADSHIGGEGIWITGSGNRVVRATFDQGGGGLGLPAVLLVGDANVVRDATIPGMSPGATAPAVEVRSGTGNVLRGIQTVDPYTTRPFAPDGILVGAAATDTLLVDNLVENYPGDGIQVDSASTTLRFNAANDNGDLGIEAVPGVTGKGNTASGNGNPLQCTNIAC